MQQLLLHKSSIVKSLTVKKVLKCLILRMACLWFGAINENKMVMALVKLTFKLLI